METAPTKNRKKKKSGKGKNKTSANSELALSHVTNGVVDKSDPNAQKGSATSLCQELRCSSETSRDGGYSSESTSINHDNTTCSSLEGSEIACADDCCRLCPDFISSDPEPRIVQGPYRSLMEQLEVSLYSWKCVLVTIEYTSLCKNECLLGYYRMLGWARMKKIATGFHLKLQLSILLLGAKSGNFFVQV